MRLIDRLVIKDMIGPFLNGLFMFIILIFAAAYLFPATDLLVSGVPLITVAKVVMFSLPSVVTQTFPMAMLLGSLLAFGRLSQDREAVAMFAAGVSFGRMIRPVWLLGIAVSVAAFFWNDLVVPPATIAYWNLKQNAGRSLLKIEKPLSYSIFTPDGKEIDETIAISGGLDAKTKTLKNVSITKFSHEPGRKGEPDAVIYAKRATAVDDKGLNWKFYDGRFTLFGSDPKTRILEDLLTVDFKRLDTLPRAATIGKTFDGVLNSEVTDPNRKSFSELQREIAEDRANGADTKGKEVDLYGKIALPLASLIFGIVGAALGLNTQRGGGKAVGFGVAIFIVFLYWIFYHSMFVVGKGGAIPPFLAAFLADIVGGIAGYVLVRRASK